MASIKVEEELLTAPLAARGALASSHVPLRRYGPHGRNAGRFVRSEAERLGECMCPT
jgi:hypothetical protein